MNDSIGVFAAHATDYDAQRRRLVPCFDEFYGTAVGLLGLREGQMLRILDLGAGTGLLSEAVLDRYPAAELVLLDGAAAMLEQAGVRLPAASITTLLGDLRDELPAGPFDGVVSALAIHHLEHSEKRKLFAGVREALSPGGVFVNAEHVAGPSPWLSGVYRDAWREGCRAAGASAQELAEAEVRMEADRCSDVATQLAWMEEAGLEECDCFFKELHFAVLAGWRADGPGHSG